MSEQLEIEVTVIVDSDGNFVASDNADTANETYAENYADDAVNRQVMTLVLKVPCPSRPLIVSGEVTGDETPAQPITLTVEAA